MNWRDCWCCCPGQIREWNTRWKVRSRRYGKNFCAKRKGPRDLETIALLRARQQQWGPVMWNSGVIVVKQGDGRSPDVIIRSSLLGCLPGVMILLLTQNIIADTIEGQWSDKGRKKIAQNNWNDGRSWRHSEFESTPPASDWSTKVPAIFILKAFKNFDAWMWACRLAFETVSQVYLRNFSALV